VAAGERSGVVGAQYPLVGLQDLLVQPQRLPRVPVAPDQRGEIVAAVESVWVVGSQHSLVGLQGLLVKP
jgi:hypothetical protein